LVNQIEDECIERRDPGEHFKDIRLANIQQDPSPFPIYQSGGDPRRFLGGLPYQRAVMLQDRALPEERNKLDYSYCYKQPGEQGEPPVYLQVFIGFGFGGALLWCGFGLVVDDRHHRVLGGILVAVGVFFAGSGFSAIGFGTWRGFWRLLGL